MERVEKTMCGAAPLTFKNENENDNEDENEDENGVDIWVKKKV